MSKKSIYIIGSGGFAKEVYFLLKELNIYNIMGFIDYEKKIDYIILDDVKIDIIEEKDFLDKISNVDVCIGSGYPSNLIKFAPHCCLIKAVVYLFKSISLYIAVCVSGSTVR